MTCTYLVLKAGILLLALAALFQQSREICNDSLKLFFCYLWLLLHKVNEKSVIKQKRNLLCKGTFLKPSQCKEIFLVQIFLVENFQSPCDPSPQTLIPSTPTRLTSYTMSNASSERQRLEISRCATALGLCRLQVKHDFIVVPYLDVVRHGLFLTCLLSSSPL